MFSGPEFRFSDAASYCLTALLACTALTTSGAQRFSEPFRMAPVSQPGGAESDPRHRGTVRLVAGPDGRPHQLSGLAWDDDENLLYALSDDAYVVHLRPFFQGGRLFRTKLVKFVALLDEHGTPLNSPFADSEGLLGRFTDNGVRGDSELVVSFEGRPRIIHFNTQGAPVSQTELPLALRNRSYYAGSNKQLEAITGHPQYGIITAPERAPRASSGNFIPLWSISGEQWNYRPDAPGVSAVVGLETAPNGDILVLERQFRGLLRPLIIVVQQVRLDDDNHALVEAVEKLRLDSSRGWALDNFEAIARHQGDCYFLVSDDNASVLQKTLLSYFYLPQNSDALSVRVNAASTQPDCMDASGNPVDAR